MLKLVIADSDEAYLDRLSAYLRSKLGSRAEICAYSRKEALLKYMESCRPADILLAAPEMLEGQKLTAETNIWLCESEPEEPGELNVIFKYKPASAIFEEVLSFYKDKGNGVLKHLFRGDRKTKVAAVHSCRGGSGKTLAALALSIRLMDRGMKVLYFNLETVSSLHYYLPERAQERGSMSSLLYYARESPGKLQPKLEISEYISHVLDITYLENPGCAFEICELAGNDLRKLIEELRAAGRFDVVVLDFDPGLTSLTPVVFSGSDAVVNILNDDAISFFKQKFLERELLKHPDFIQEAGRYKPFYIINRYVNELKQELEDWGQDVYKVPVCPDIFITGTGGRKRQLNPASDLFKAYELPAAAIAERMGLLV